MMNLYEAIGCRHSVRKYTDREVTEKLRGQILSYFDKTSRLNDRIRVEAVIFDNTKKKADVHGLWKVDAPYYLAIYSDQEEGCERNAGYLMEQMVLYMTAKGIGTCYLGSVQPAQKVRGGKRCLMMVAFGYPRASFTVKARWQSASRSMNSVFSRKKPESREDRFSVRRCLASVRDEHPSRGCSSSIPTESMCLP